jgi:MFS family permease
MIGPAIAGLLIAAIGTGWVFVLNAVSFGAVLGSLTFLRVHELHPRHHAERTRAGLVEGFRYVLGRPDLRTLLLMLFLIGTFGLNFPIFISTMAVTVFHAGASRYGFLTSTMAIGSVTGALLAARRAQPYFTLLIGSAAMFGFALMVASVLPTYWLFGLMLIAIGVSAQTFTTSTNSFMQLSTEPQMRGRIVAIFLAIAMGGTPIGAPIVGWVADTFGPRWALGVGAAGGLLAAALGVRYLVKYRNLRVRLEDRRLRIDMDELASKPDSADASRRAA